MHPILFSLGEFRLYSFEFFYQIVIITVAVVVGLELERESWTPPPLPKFLHRIPEDWRSSVYFTTLYGAAVFMLVALGGAHLFYALVTTALHVWSLNYSPLQWAMLFVYNLYGSMQVGGFLTCWAFSYYWAKWWRLGFLQFLDAAILGCAAGIVPGRIACFLGGCCYGKPTTLPWGVALNSTYSLKEFPEGTLLHPSQLYEMAIGLVIFVYMWRKRGTNTYTGQNFTRFLVLHSFFRFFTEIVRADTPRGVIWGWLSVSQVVSVGLVIAGFALHRKLSRLTAKN